MHADEFQWITPEVAFWEAYAPAVKCDLSSAALRLGERLVFIDPIPLAGDALAELTDGLQPALIVLTNGNHERAAAAYRERWGIPIAAHEEARAGLTLAPEQVLRDGDSLLDELTVVSIPGAGPGEIAVAGKSGVVCAGDALIQLPPDGLALLPAKYCRDAKVLPDSLRKLLRFDIRVLTFAHGSPIVAGARSKLEALLA